MKKLKFILCVGILGVMTYGGITAYNHVTMTEQERLLLANVEALTSGESSSVRDCFDYYYDYGQPGYVLEITHCPPCLPVLAEGCSNPSKCTVK